MAFLRERFVLVAVDARHARRREDWAGDFVRDTRCVTFTASGRKCVVDAAGRRALGNVHDLRSLQKVWAAWEALPEAERQPGRAIAGRDPADARPVVPAHEPPEGALVLRTYTRQLETAADGSLRYTEPEDYPVDEPAKMRSGSPRRQAARFREAGHDFMWVPAAEWRALVPEEASVGMRGEVLESLKLRLLRYHLDPERGLGEAQWFTRATAGDGSLRWEVEAVEGERVRLRFSGKAALRREGGGVRPPVAFDAALSGTLSWDRAAGEVVEWRMLALGEVLNTPRGVRDGRRPLGVAFELVRDPSPAERVVPRGGRDDVGRYLEVR